jgi:hypothetical protein
MNVFMLAALTTRPPRSNARDREQLGKRFPRRLLEALAFRYNANCVNHG